MQNIKYFLKIRIEEIIKNSHIPKVFNLIEMLEYSLNEFFHHYPPN